MSVIAIANSKGGSGKTANVFNLGAELARKGEKVLLWDMDPQASLTQCFKVKFSQNQLYTEDVLATDRIDPRQAPVEVKPNLFLVPATSALGGFESVLKNGEENLLRLRRAVEKVRGLGFTYILLDPPGATDIFMAATLAAADYVLIPVRPTDSDFSTMVSFKADIDKVKAINPKLEVRGILFNQVITASKNKNIYHAFLEEAAWENLVCKTSIRMATSIANAPGSGKDVIEFDPKSKAAEDYRNLAQEVLSWN